MKSQRIVINIVGYTLAKFFYSLFTESRLFIMVDVTGMAEAKSKESCKLISVLQNLWKYIAFEFVCNSTCTLTLTVRNFVFIKATATYPSIKATATTCYTYS